MSDRTAHANARRAVGDAFAAELRGFGAPGILAMLVITLGGNVIVGPMLVVPVGAILALAWAWMSRTPWREIGYVRPRSWLGTLAAGVVLGSALKIVMKMIVMPLLGADPINHAYQFLAGNRALLPTAALAMMVVGFAEETVFRGYLFERFGKLFGAGAGARTAIVLLTAAWFGVAHYGGQGLAGVQQGAIVGLLFGTIFAAGGRLFMLMAAHAAFDLTALAMIYWDIESRVAHFVFP